MGPPPNVTGISPKEASAGTKITIRGENLGTSPQDLVDVYILGVDCLLTAEWKSSTKITALCPAAPKEHKGKIIVCTKSGGEGTCNVQFRFYKELISGLKQVAGWQPEKFFIQKRTHAYSQINRVDYEDALGISTGETSNEGAGDTVEKIESNDQQLQDAFENKSSDLRSPNFDPDLFLLTNHSRTEFADLKHGVSYLRRKVAGENENQLSFIKSNVGCIMEQLDTLKNMKLSYEYENRQQAKQGLITTKVESSMSLAKQEADQMFCDVLGRKDRADATRNAINVMNRFKFFFFLPSNFESNLAKGDFDRIIDEYERAITLYGNSESEIFKKYLVEIEKGLAALKEQLNRSIHADDLTVDQQKKLIANLVQIDTESDPAWNCLQLRYNNLLTVLMEECDDAGNVSSNNTPQVRQINPCQHQPDVEWSRGLVGVEMVPSKIAVAERLTRQLANHLPDLWKLGQAYFKGDLAVTPGPGKQVVFKEMILGSIRYYSTLIRETMAAELLETEGTTTEFKPNNSVGEEYTAIMGESPWLIYCLRFVRHLHTVMIELDLPGDALDLIVNLLSDLRLHCLQVIFQTIVDKVNQLHFVEDWVQETTDEFGSITKLPVSFLSIVTNSVHLVKEVLTPNNEREEVILSSEKSAEDFQQLIQNVMSSFAFTLENTAIEEHDSVSSVCPSESLKLIICMNNCRYSSSEVLPKIRVSFQEIFNIDLSSSFEGAMSQYQILVQKLLEAYIELKCDPIVAVIEPCMYAGKFDWARCPKPKDARDYIKGIGKIMKYFLKSISIMKEFDP